MAKRMGSCSPATIGSPDCKPTSIHLITIKLALHLLVFPHRWCFLKFLKKLTPPQTSIRLIKMTCYASSSRPSPLMFFGILPEFEKFISTPVDRYPESQILVIPILNHLMLVWSRWNLLTVLPIYNGAWDENNDETCKNVHLTSPEKNCLHCCNNIRYRVLLRIGLVISCSIPDQHRQIELFFYRYSSHLL